jgi:Arc/MetJ-type ribon-helix-helix transcriptional regulator
MKKTSVYLTEDEAADLRGLAIREGRSQAELIRDGIRRVIDDAAHRPREFRSLGKGHGGGKPYQRLTSSKLYEKVYGTDK